MADSVLTVCQIEGLVLYTRLVLPTVRAVLDLPSVRRGEPTVIGGAAGLDAPVRWVHVSDVSDLQELLSGGEMVLTTGPPFAGPDPVGRGYLRMLADLRVAALVVELGRSVTRLPAATAECADALGLPVVTLSRPTAFVAVTEETHRLIVADQFEELQFAHATHQVFTSLNLARATPTDIVARAAEMLGDAVVLEDLTHRVLAFAPGPRPTAELLADWTERSRRAPVDWTVVGVGDAAPGGELAAGSARWGRLIRPGSTDRTDTDGGGPSAPGASSGSAGPASGTGRTRMVLERAAQSLHLHRMLERDRDALLVQAFGGLLDDLLTGRVADETEAQARAAALGLQVPTGAGARHVPVIVRVGPAAGDDPSDAVAAGEVDRRVLSAARQEITTAGGTAIGSIRRPGTIALVVGSPRAALIDRLLDVVCAGVERRLSGRSGEARAWAVGTSGPTTGLVAAARALTEADHVAEVGLATVGTAQSAPGIRQRLFRPSDVRLRGLLTLLRADHRVQQFAESELGRLLDHDARTGERLTDVLRVFLACGGGKTDTARRTGLSRPTLYSRLQTIERILGVSLESVESRTSLHAALMVVDLH